VSFELELVRVDKDGKAAVVDRQDCPYGLTLAKVMARTVLDQRSKDGVNTVRIIDAGGKCVFVCDDGDLTRKV
jgi:hypothetical protein